MTYEDQEPQHCCLFEVGYAATYEEANDVWEHVAGTVDALRYQQIDSILGTVRLDASDKDVRSYAESLCLERAQLAVRLAGVVREKLRSMGVMA